LIDAFLPCLPRLVRCSQDLRTDSRITSSPNLPIEVAVEFPWIAVNHPRCAFAIVIDIDHADGPELADDLVRGGGPRPYLVIDPYSGRSHAIFLLNTPVKLDEGSSQRAIGLLNLAARLLANTLRGTALSGKTPVKNPFGLSANFHGKRKKDENSSPVPALRDAYDASGSPLAWHTTPGDNRVELRAIVTALGNDKEVGVRPDGRPNLFVPEAGARSGGGRRPPVEILHDPRGRNCTVFQTVSRVAYRTQERDATVIREIAQEANETFPIPLPGAEISGLARSVARYMNSPRGWRPRKGTPHGRRGRDARAGIPLTPKDRQALAGSVTAAGRRGKTDVALLAAAQSMIEDGQSLTQRAVATKSGCSLRTVQSRWKTPSFLPYSPKGRRAMSQDAAPSGSAGHENGTVSVSFAEAAELQRSETEHVAAVEVVVGALESVTSRLSRRGASPEPLPAIDPIIAADPLVAAALKRARAANLDVQRRLQGREAAKTRTIEKAARNERYAVFVQQPDGVSRFQAELAELDGFYEARIAKVMNRKLEAKLIMGWRSAFDARYRAWEKAAREEARRSAHAGEPQVGLQLQRGFGPSETRYQHARRVLNPPRERWPAYSDAKRPVVPTEGGR
jgi:hypothetical protein